MQKKFVRRVAAAAASVALAAGIVAAAPTSAGAVEQRSSWSSSIDADAGSSFAPDTTSFQAFVNGI